MTTPKEATREALHPDLEALMPRPAYANVGDEDLFTADQVRKFGRAVCEAATERAAKMVEDTDVVDVPGPNSYYCQLGDAAATRAACAAAIRSGGEAAS